MANKSTQPDVTIIVPCYNEEKTIEGLLDAILSQTYPAADLEVIISDGMSTDGTRDKIGTFQRAHPELSIQVLDNLERNIPSALNRAVEASRGAIIIRLDAHSIPAPDYVEHCVAILNQADIANVGGVWEIRPGGESWIARGIAGAAAHPLGAGGARYRVGGPAGSVDTVPFGAFQRAWIDRVGQFDETLLTNEDYEFNVRLRAAGGEVRFDPRIWSIYLARTTLPALARQYTRYGYWKARMLKRHPKSIRLRQLIPPLFVLSILALVILAFFAPIARAILAVELGIYGTISIFSALLEAFRRKDLALILTFPLALSVMHLCWGGAFIVGALGALLEAGDDAS